MIQVLLLLCKIRIARWLFLKCKHKTVRAWIRTIVVHGKDDKPSSAADLGPRLEPLTFIHLQTWPQRRWTRSLQFPEPPHEAEEEGAGVFRGEAEAVDGFVADDDDVISHPHQDHPGADPDLPLSKRRVGRRHVVHDVPLPVTRRKNILLLFLN